MTTTKEMIEARVKSIPYQHCWDGCDQRTGEICVAEMAAFMQSPEYLKAYYEERIAELGAEIDAKDMLSDGASWARCTRAHVEIEAYKIILAAIAEATK